jgi:hypothetical protein
MIAYIGIGIAVLIIVAVLWMLLTRQLREKYAVLWLLLGIVLLALGLFPGLLTAATEALGVQLPVNLLFATAIAVLLGVTLHLSWELSQSEAEARRLAEEVAIIGARLDALEAEAGSGQKDVGQDPSAGGRAP